MQRSTERILTTHVGSLIRPPALQEFLRDWSQQDAEETAKVLHKLSESLRESARATAAGPITTTKRKEHING